MKLGIGKERFVFDCGLAATLLGIIGAACWLNTVDYREFYALVNLTGLGYQELLATLSELRDSATLIVGAMFMFIAAIQNRRVVLGMLVTLPIIFIYALGRTYAHLIPWYIVYATIMAIPLATLDVWWFERK